MDGKPEALKPIVEKTLAWVAAQRNGAELRRPTPDELRRIELCALVAQDVAHFHDLYELGSLSVLKED